MKSLHQWRKEYAKSKRFQFWLEQLPIFGRYDLKRETGVSYERLKNRSDIKMSQLISVADFAGLSESDIVNYYKG